MFVNSMCVLQCNAFFHPFLASYIFAGNSPDMPNDYYLAQLEALAAYFMADFSEAVRLDIGTGQTEAINLPDGIDSEPGEDPIIIMTPGGEHAMGGYTETWPDYPQEPDRPGFFGTRYTYFR